MSPDGIGEIHKRFCELLPDELLWVKDPETGERMQVIPGALRERDVKVGKLMAVSPGALPRFIKKFEQTYSRLEKRKLSLLPRQLITGCCGYTRSWMATAAWRD